MLQLVISNLLLLTQSFEAVLDFIQFSLTFCSFFTVLGVIKMRITHPNLPRPYRAWGYPVTPIIFLSVTAFMMYYLVVNRPLQSLAGLRNDVGRPPRLLYLPPALERSLGRLRKRWPRNHVLQPCQKRLRLP